MYILDVPRDTETSVVISLHQQDYAVAGGKPYVDVALTVMSLAEDGVKLLGDVSVAEAALSSSSSSPVPVTPAAVGAPWNRDSSTNGKDVSPLPG